MKGVTNFGCLYINFKIILDNNSIQIISPTIKERVFLRRSPCVIAVLDFVLYEPSVIRDLTSYESKRENVGLHKL
jgi:hypothetical protein